MTANLDRAPPPARTVNRADRVFNPFAARHHSFNLQCLNPNWKGAWQHFGALTQFRCNCPGENWVGCSPEWGRGVKGGDAASFCQLQGYPRRTQRGTKENGDGDPRGMTANLDRAPPAARTVNRADRVFNPFAARHHSFNLQCLNRIWKGAWQHIGALTQFRCSCPGGGGAARNGAGCEGGGDRAIRTGNRRGHWEVHDTNLRRRNSYERLRVFTNDCERLRVLTSVYERLRTFTSVYECLRTIASVCERLRVLTSVYERLRTFTSVYECLRTIANDCERLRVLTSVCERLRAFASVCECL